MEVLAPLALAAVGSAAANGLRISTGGRRSMGTSTLVEKDTPIAHAQGMQFDNSNQGMNMVAPQQSQSFDPIMAHYQSNAVPNRMDNIQVLRTVEKDPKYALTPQSGQDFQYDQMNRGSSMLENQWYYSNLTKDSETPLSMGYLPEYKRSSGVMLRDPDTPDILKPKKRELLQEEVWVAQPEPDRRFYNPITGEQARRARNESKYASGTGALDGFIMNDRPGALGGPWHGWSTGLEPTRQFVGFHPKARFFRKYDNLRQRNPHGLRAGNKDSHHFDMRSDLKGQYSNEKKEQISNYHAIAIGDGGFKHPHLAHDLRKVDLRHTQRDIATPLQEGLMGRTAPPSGYHESQLMSQIQ